MPWLIILVPERDGCIMICVDYIVTVNLSLQIDQCPLSNSSHLLTEGQMFDLTVAYQQMLLDNESAKLNTRQGLCECCRLPLGLASAPAIFKHAMESKIPSVICSLDDSLITGHSPAEHLQTIARCCISLRSMKRRAKLMELLPDFCSWIHLHTHQR